MPHPTLSAADAGALGLPVQRFIADYIIPLEQEAFAAGVDEKLRIRLQQMAHDVGVLAPQAPAEYGGGGADFVTTTVLLEKAGYSLKGTEESSRVKVFIGEATCRIVDRAVQLAGGAGVTQESVVGRIYADIRAFRSYDGPSEAHRAAISRRAVARIQRNPA